MRKATVFFALFVIYISCKKEEVVVVSQAITTSMSLKIDNVINDSTIVPKWSKYTGDNFQKYKLVRTAEYLKNGKFERFVEPVDSSTNVNHLTFTERSMPFARYVYYDLFVIKNEAPPYQSFPIVARALYERPNSLLSVIPKDVLIDKPQQRLYITDQHKVTIVDYNTGRQVRAKEFSTSIGFCSLGDYNGSKELYVPVNDGWVEILDATTLERKDRIYVAGFGIGSVVAVNQKVYVSSSDRSHGGYANCVKVYDRVTKELVGRTGYWDQTRLVHLEGSTVELVDLTINLGPTDLLYYQFSAAGVPLVKKQDSYHGDFYLDANIVRSFPDGTKFITSSSGTIFNKSLLFDRYIKQHAGYSDFAFNSDGSIIYAAYGTQKKIDVITYPGTTTINSYSTNLYPYKIFRDGNTLICVGKTTINQQTTYLLIEKIDL